MTQDVAAILARANLPEARHRLCLDAALYARWTEATAALAVAEAEVSRAEGVKRLSGVPTEVAAAAEMAAATVDELRAEVEAASLSFVLRALPSHAYNALVIEHPPRKGNLADERVWGFNASTLVPALIRACAVEPDMTPDQWVALFDAITDAQMDDLAGAVLRINRHEKNAVPFLSPASGQTTD